MMDGWKIINNYNGNEGDSAGLFPEHQRLDDFEYLGEDYDTEEVVEEHEVIPLDEKHIAVHFFIFKINSEGVEFTGKLYFPAILESLRSLGYYKRTRSDESFLFIREKEGIIREVAPYQMKDDFYTKHLKMLGHPLIFRFGDMPVVVSVEAQQQAYLKQANQVFNEKFLQHLDTHTKPVLEDNKTTAYFFFINVIAIASVDGISTVQYSQLENTCVWEDHMIAHDFEYRDHFEDAHYPTFIRNVAGNERERKEAFYSGIGYLLHNYIAPSRSQAVVCYDEVPSESGDPNGGTGKGVFCKAIKQLRDTFKLDGKNIRRDDKFKFQGLTERTQMFWIDDIAENFPFEMLHSAITDGFTVERKYHHQFYIPAEKSPKVVLCSNTILSQGGTTNIRRQFILEFGDYYSSKIVTGSEEPIKEEHGGLFFDKDSWDQEEWNKFFSFMIWSVQFYFENGLKPCTQVGQERSRLIQMTSAAFNEWVGQRELQIGEEYENTALYEEYCGFGDISKDFFKQRTFTGWIKIFAETKGWEVKVRASNGRRYTRFEAR